MCVYTTCSRMNCFFFSPFFTPVKIRISSLHNFLFFFLLAVKWKSKKSIYFFLKLYFFTCALCTKTIHTIHGRERSGRKNFQTRPKLLISSMSHPNHVPNSVHIVNGGQDIICKAPRQLLSLCLFFFFFFFLMN
jgi:hypothetical protein